MTHTTHVLETLLDRARHGQLHLSAPMIDAFLETKDALQEQLTAYQAGKEPDAERVAHICGVLQQLAMENNAAAAPVPAPAPAPAPVVQAAAPAEEGGSSSDGVLVVRFARLSDSECELLAGELANLGTVLTRTRSNDQLTVRLATTCDPDDIVAVCCFVIDESQIDITREVVDVAEPVVAVEAPVVQPPAAPAPAPAAAAPAPASAGAKESSSIRVDVEKVDQLINLVGELVITQSMLTQAATVLDPWPTSAS